MIQPGKQNMESWISPDKKYPYTFVVLDLTSELDFGKTPEY